MESRWFGTPFATTAALLMSLVFVTKSDAQIRRHHHHDAAGHMVDHAGHHIDQYGRHTGAVGVYHNQYGQYSYQYPGYNYGNYGSPAYQTNQTYVGNQYTGGQNYGGYNNQFVPIPQNVVPYALQPNATATTSGGTITIFNPADSGGEVKYSLNGSVYTIKPGSTQTLQYDRVWTVEFGSGGSAGNIRYSLRASTYKFKVTDAGWNLFETQDRVNEIPPAPIPKNDSIGNEPRPGLVP